MIETMLTSLLSGKVVDVLAKKTKLSPAILTSIVSVAMPFIIKGIMNNKNKNAQGLLGALASHASSASSTQEAAENSNALDGAKILGHLFGDKLGSVEKQIATQSGAKKSEVSSALESLAPVVLNKMGRETSKANSNDLLGGLTALLGADEDGFGLDDLLSMATGSSDKKSNPLTSLLGGLFGNKG